MRTQTQRRRTTVALVLLALATATVLWVAFTMHSSGNTGLALDGSGSGSVKSGSLGSGSVGTDSAESDSTGSDSSKSGSSKSSSPESQTDHSGSTGSSTTGSTESGSTGSGTTGISNTAPGNTGSNIPGSGSARSGHGSGVHAGDHGTGNGNGNTGGGQTDPSDNRDGLAVRVGTVGALFPGARTTAPVTVTNQTTGDVALTEIRVSSPGTTGCDTAYLNLGHRTLNLGIHGRGNQVTTQVRFGLRAAAPDSCKGKTIPFSVSVQAVSR